MRLGIARIFLIPGISGTRGEEYLPGLCSQVFCATKLTHNCMVPRSSRLHPPTTCQTGPEVQPSSLNSLLVSHYTLFPHSITSRHSGENTTLLGLGHRQNVNLRNIASRKHPELRVACQHSQNYTNRVTRPGIKFCFRSVRLGSDWEDRGARGPYNGDEIVDAIDCVDAEEMISD